MGGGVPREGSVQALTPQMGQRSSSGPFPKRARSVLLSGTITSHDLGKLGQRLPEGPRPFQGPPVESAPVPSPRRRWCRPLLTPKPEALTDTTREQRGGHFPCQGPPGSQWATCWTTVHGRSRSFSVAVLPTELRNRRRVPGGPGSPPKPVCVPPPHLSPLPLAAGPQGPGVLTCPSPPPLTPAPDAGLRPLWAPVPPPHCGSGTSCHLLACLRPQRWDRAPSPDGTQGEALRALRSLVCPPLPPHHLPCHTLSHAVPST